MQALGLRGGVLTPSAATPRARSASTSPPPSSAPRPSCRQSRRVTPSQFVAWIGHRRSLACDQSLNTNSGVLISAHIRSSAALPAGRAWLRRTASRRAARSVLGRQSAVRQQVQLLDDLAGGFLRWRQLRARGRRRSSPCGAGSGAFIRCSACTTVVSRGPLAGRVLVRVGPAEAVEEHRLRRGPSTAPSPASPAASPSNVSGTPVTSLTASSSTSARSRWR